LIARIAGSNSAEGMKVRSFCLFCVVRPLTDVLIAHADDSCRIYV
jgi:hypothetical protein